MGYFCVAANTKWAIDHPELSYGTPPWMHIPLADEYLDYVCKSIQDGLTRTGMNGS